MKKEINVCQNGHHWIDDPACPYCGSEIVKKLELRDGDCVRCGYLCPSYAYGCDSPDPIDVEDNK